MVHREPWVGQIEGLKVSRANGTEFYMRDGMIHLKWARTFCSDGFGARELDMALMGTKFRIENIFLGNSTSFLATNIKFLHLYM